MPSIKKLLIVITLRVDDKSKQKLLQKKNRNKRPITTVTKPRDGH